MDENLPVIRISVRNLVEFILREGDIDNRTGGGQDPENMQDGKSDSPEDPETDGIGLSGGGTS